MCLQGHVCKACTYMFRNVGHLEIGQKLDQGCANKEDFKQLLDEVAEARNSFLECQDFCLERIRKRAKLAKEKAAAEAAT